MTLKEFLKENRALVKFRANYCLRSIFGRKTKTEAENFITENSLAPNGIRAAFNWARSPEGIDYWTKLDKEWVAEFNKK